MSALEDARLAWNEAEVRRIDALRAARAGASGPRAGALWAASDAAEVEAAERLEDLRRLTVWPS